MNKKAELDLTSDVELPRHIAIIMDGNNRWAKERRLPSLAGHKAGVDSVRGVIEACIELGVESLSLFAFSTENWKRPEFEVRGLMELFMLALDRETRKLDKNNIRLKVIGDKTRFSKGLQNRIEKAEKLTENNDRLTLNIAANYGGQWDIVEAAKKFAQDCLAGDATPQALDRDSFNRYVSLADQPAPDLCIRTGGESRMSNFLVWQMAYTEFYFVDHYWPDFGRSELIAAVKDFTTRERRFGRTSEQLEDTKGCLNKE